MEPRSKAKKETIVMPNTITYCIDNPIKTDLVVWLNEHLGRVSVGKNVKDIMKYWRTPIGSLIFRNSTGWQRKTKRITLTV